MKQICDACASGNDIQKCQLDVWSTIIDGCGRTITYCSKYKEIEK